MNNHESLFKCGLFEKQELDIDKLDTFTVEQDEIILKDQQNQSVFNKIKVIYKCQWQKQNNWDSLKPVILICTKNNSDLLKLTIQNLQKNNIDKKCNIIITDDRSTEDIKQIVLQNKFSYLRIDNEKGFNFSMLNNIPAFLSHKMGCKEIILWNSDLWCVKEQYFDVLLEKHRLNNSTVSGTKLVYPPKELSLNKDDINKDFKQIKEWRETIQFGGSTWMPTTIVTLSPMHAYRFKKIQDNRVNCDKGETFVTGALQIINLEWFINNGGLNPSLSKNFQDVDLCLRAIEQDKLVNYFGKDIFFYHDESYSINQTKKHDLQLFSDNILFAKIWNTKLQSLVV